MAIKGVFSGAEACATRGCVVRNSADAGQRANCDCGAAGERRDLASAIDSRARAGIADATRSRRQPDLPAVILYQSAAMAFVDA